MELYEEDEADGCIGPCQDDANARGPDIGLIVTLGLATIVFAVQYLRTQRPVN